MQYFGMECLLPQIEMVSTSRRTGIVRTKKVPVLPGLIFVTEVDLDLAPGRHAMSKSPFVRGVKLFPGNSRLVMSKHEIQELSSMERIKSKTRPVDKRPEIGSRVELADGPFTGFSGIVEKHSGDHPDMFCVEVEIFGRSTPLWLFRKNIKGAK
jgi:transcription antitermination factor NusG